MHVSKTSWHYIPQLQCIYISDCFIESDLQFTIYIASGQFHEERDKVKINKYVYFHCKLIALTQTVFHVLGKNIFILFANLFS